MRWVSTDPFPGFGGNEEVSATTVGELVGGGFCLSSGDLGVGELVEHDDNAFWKSTRPGCNRPNYRQAWLAAKGILWKPMATE